MCHTVGSIDQATGVCPMCKVFRPSASRCPHVREVCRNRNMHPQGHDVLYLRNAEVQTFNGCGFCKWGRYNSRNTGQFYTNPGWPGCCRIPNNAEKLFIPAADWPTVSLVHHVPIPPEVKALLESITRETTRERVSPAFTGGNGRGAPPGPQSTPTSVRRSNSAAVGPNQSRGDPANPLKLAPVPMVIPSKTRTGGSPQQVTAALTTRGDGVVSSSLSNTSASVTDQTPVQRERRERPSVEIYTEKRRDGSASREVPTKNSPGRKNAELTGTLTRRGSTHRASLSAVVSPTQSPKSPEAQAQQPGHRRTQTVTLTSGANISPVSRPSTLSRATTNGAERERERDRNREERGRPSPSREPAREGPSPPREPKRLASIERIPSSGSSTSSGSSGSASDNTVTSDGGFTDYLSDESDAELQRQAEVKAALVTQSTMEEMEFKAARMQLAGVDLRPPKSWAAGNGGRMQAAYSRG